MNISIEIDGDQSHARFGYSRVRIGNININGNDIVDGIHARYITVGSLTEWAANQTLDQAQSEWIEKLCDKIRKNNYEPYFGSRIGKFVNACSLAPRSGFMSELTNRHAFDLVIAPEAKAESKLYKDIAFDLIFRSPQLQQIEFKGGYILERLFNALRDNCGAAGGGRLQVLPIQVQELLKTATNTSEQQRRLCDYTAGLTDGLAVRTYKRLYDPDFGSIAELA